MTIEFFTIAETFLIGVSINNAEVETSEGQQSSIVLEIGLGLFGVTFFITNNK